LDYCIIFFPALIKIILKATDAFAVDVLWCFKNIHFCQKRTRK